MKTARARIWLAAFLLILSWAALSPLAAQDAGEPGAPAGTVEEKTATEPADAAAPAALDMAAWESVARRAEQAIESGRASDQALQSLRADLVDWRELFSTARSENSVLISTLKTQIASLGPPPGEGATEPAVLTESRDALTAQLAEVEAPAKAADVAYQRADSLIKGVDELLRKRQTNAIYTLSDSPLNPTLWPAALSTLQTTLANAWRGVRESTGTEIQRAEFVRNLPVTALLGVLALLLLGRGRAWMMRLGRSLSTPASAPATGVWSFLISLGQVVLPYLGILALMQGLYSAGVLGLRAQIMVDTLPALGLSIFAALWLAHRVFATPDMVRGVIELDQRNAGRAYLVVGLVGFIYGLRFTFEAIASYELYPQAVLTVLRFPFVLAVGLLTAELGLILRRDARAVLTAAAEPGDGEKPAGFMRYLEANLGLAMVAVGLLAPVVAAVGYGRLAEAVIYPAVLSVALAGALLALHQFMIDLYGMLSGRDREVASAALLPVLASTVLFLASLPVVALIWGTRVTQLQELLTRLREGVTIGGNVVTIGNLASLVVVFALGLVLTRLIQGALRNAILPRTKMDVGGRNAVTAGVGYLGYVLAAIVAVTAAGFNLSSLAIVAGALSVGIGFGLQNVVSNFVSGIILLIERPISEGDWIEVGGQSGYVREISVRSTRVETFDRTDVIIPNADLIQGTVTNYTRTNLLGRAILSVGVAYGTDTRKVETILREVAEAHPIVAVKPPPSVYFREFGADSLEFEIRAILKDVNFVLSVKSDLRHEIARRFAEEGIEIPFAQRDIWLRNPEALAEAKAGIAGSHEADAAGQGGAQAQNPNAAASSPVEGDPDD